MNQKLSETRAGGVRDYLVQPGVGGGKLSNRDRLWKEFAGGLQR
jgi:flagellar motor protein MotB